MLNVNQYKVLQRKLFYSQYILSLKRIFNTSPIKAYAFRKDKSSKLFRRSRNNDTFNQANVRYPIAFTKRWKFSLNSVVGTLTFLNRSRKPTCETIEILIANIRRQYWQRWSVKYSVKIFCVSVATCLSVSIEFHLSVRVLM